jgi:hypothetical protein
MRIRKMTKNAGPGRWCWWSPINRLRLRPFLTLLHLLMFLHLPLLLRHAAVSTRILHPLFDFKNYIFIQLRKTIKFSPEYNKQGFL